MNRARVLTLSTVYPNPEEPALGLFVRSRLEHVVSEQVEAMVAAPVGLVDYANARRKFFRSRGVPRRCGEGPIEVVHPRWLYPPLGGVWNALWLAAQLLRPVAKLRRDFAFELIDAHFGYPEGIAAALLSWWFRTPFLITLRGNETRFARSPVLRWAMSKALRRADRVIAVAESLRRFAVSLGVEPERAVTVPNGVDAELYHPRDRQECRRRHGIPASAKVVLSAGYLIERKGHHRVAAALRDIRDRGIAVELLIAGGPGREGEFEGELRRRVSSLGMDGCVRFLGPVAPAVLAELMCAADVFCLASNREGWPNVVHEAVSCGAPVVAAAVGGVAEMIPSEAIGLVVPSGDAAALRDALWRALNTTWDRDLIAEWGSRRTWERVGAETRALMLQVLDETRQRSGQSARPSASR